MKLLGLLLVAVAGCATQLPAGAVCQATSDCEPDLVCHDLGQFSGAACTVPGKSCTKTCTSDGDCASLGASWKCFATCGTDKVCAETAN